MAVLKKKKKSKKQTKPTKQGSYVVGTWKAAAVLALDMKLILELAEAV